MFVVTISSLLLGASMVGLLEKRVLVILIDCIAYIISSNIELLQKLHYYYMSLAHIFTPTSYVCIGYKKGLIICMSFFIESKDIVFS